MSFNDVAISVDSYIEILLIRDLQYKETCHVTVTIATKYNNIIF